MDISAISIVLVHPAGTTRSGPFDEIEEQINRFLVGSDAFGQKCRSLVSDTIIYETDAPATEDAIAFYMDRFAKDPIYDALALGSDIRAVLRTCLILRE